MDSTTSSPVPDAPPPCGLYRLALAAGAAVALVTLAWAAIQVRKVQLEAHHLRAELAVAKQAERAAGAASRAVPIVDHGARAAELQRRLSEAEAREKVAAEKSAAREAELDELIKFLRQENAAAQQTIERLSNPEPDPEPPAVPRTGTRSARRPQ
jgi:hypothetical protein